MICDEEANILLKKAKREIYIARRNLNDELYPEAVFDAQRAAEKAMKAAIRIVGRGYPKNHDPSGIFGEIMLKELKNRLPQELLNEVPKLGRAMNKLANMRSVAEYPIEEEGRVIPPWEQIERTDAEKAISAAEEIIAWVEKFIKWWKSVGKRQ